MRVAALVAAIVRIVQSRNIEQTEMGSFLAGARKKVWKAFLAFWDTIGEGWNGEAGDDRIPGDGGNHLIQGVQDLTSISTVASRTAMTR